MTNARKKKRASDQPAQKKDKPDPVSDLDKFNPGTSRLWTARAAPEHLVALREIKAAFLAGTLPKRHTVTHIHRYARSLGVSVSYDKLAAWLRGLSDD